MKQIFDWLREQIYEKSLCYMRMEFIYTSHALKIINEAEAKFGGHAICYLDSPCEYQNEDIRVDEPDCCEWHERDFEDSFYYSHSGKEFDYKNDVKCWNFCPYCRKKIKILEVE